MGKTGKTSDWGLVLNQAFQEESDFDRQGRVRKCFANGILIRGQEKGEIRDAQEKWGSWSMKYPGSVVWGADGERSGMGQGGWWKPLLVGQDLILCQALWFFPILCAQNSETQLVAICQPKLKIVGE